MANLLERLVLFIIFILAIGLDVSEAEIYRVGGDDGWTNIGHVDYQKWASSKNFSVGDVLAFQYNKEFHNVVRVSQRDFKACDSDKAYMIFTSGDDYFVVPGHGHFYFICGVSDHCEDGQRIDIRVPKENAAQEAPPPAAGSIAAPPISVQPPHESPHPGESDAPSIDILLPPPPPARHSLPARPSAIHQTTSNSASSAYSYKYCVVVFTLISCFFLGIN